MSENNKDYGFGTWLRENAPVLVLGGLIIGGVALAKKISESEEHDAWMRMVQADVAGKVTYNQQMIAQIADGLRNSGVRVPQFAPSFQPQLYQAQTFQPGLIAPTQFMPHINPFQQNQPQITPGGQVVNSLWSNQPQ